MPDSPPRIPGTVKGLATVSLLNDFASEMVYPLLPAFVTTSLGGGPVALGVLDGAADLAASSLRWVSGRLADRPGWRAPLILVGYLIPAVVRPLTGWAAHAWHVIGVRVLDRLGKGLRAPARDALIADLAPAPIHGRAFGLQRSADHLGAVLGALLAYHLLRRGVPIREVLTASLFPGLAAVALVLVALAGSRRRAAFDGPPAAATGAAERRPQRGPLLLLALLAATRLPEMLLLLRLQDLGLSVVMVPLIWAALHIVKSVASYPAGVLTDRIGIKPALGLGTLAYAVTVLSLGTALPPVAAVAAFLAHGLASGLLEPAERAAVARVAGESLGRAFGAYQAMAGVGALATGLGYGLVYQVHGGGPALVIAALVAAAALVGWMAFTRFDGDQPQPRSA